MVRTPVTSAVNAIRGAALMLGASVLLTCTAPQLVSAAGETGPGGTVKIVSSLPRTGSINAQTTSIVNGITMAIEEAHSKAGSFTVTFEDWDDASPERGSWDPAIESANADRAIADPEVVAYIGTYNSGAAKISMPKLNKAGLLMVSPGNTWPGLTKPGIGEPNEPAVYRPSGSVTYFRVVPADDIQGMVATAWAKEMGITKIFVLHDRELYGKGIAEIVRRRSADYGIEVVGFEGIDPKASNYRSLVTKIKQKAPGAVYFGGTTQTNAAQIVKDLRAGGLKVPFIVPDGCFETAFIEAAGAANVEGSTFVTFGGVPADKLEGRGKIFYEQYKRRFNTEPEAYAVYGYEAGRVVIDAIARAGSRDRAAIIKAAAATKNFQGALGTWSFDQNGDTSLTIMSGNTVKDGKFEFVKILSAS